MTTVLGAGRFLRLVDRDGYEVVERIGCTGVVGIIAVTDAGELILVEQHRPPLGRRVIELPAGMAGDGPSDQTEALATAAARELEEETGFRAARFRWVAEWPTSSGMTSETVNVFRAEELHKVGDGGGDAQENITVHIVSLRHVDEWLKKAVERGSMVDSKVYAALHLI